MTKSLKHIVIFVLLGHVAFAQQAVVEEATENRNVSAARKPASFSHVPFLVLKITPTAVFGQDNVLQYGAEIAPPFGKLSFAFDYGKGKGSWNLNKYIRQNQAENTTTIYRGEIRGYFSDWYPFYSMDKKPFGRYYALEFVHKDMNRTRNVATASGGTSLPDYAQFDKVETKEKEQALHIKFGKVIIINRFLFVDVYAGVGAGMYKSTSLNPDPSEEKKVILHSGFMSNRKTREPDSKGFFFSPTAGIKLALPI
ncbi:hypothetical protein GVN16_16690 [Emticicia sp. CRIBPO]|uniref:hypothetical protein n=1 Tax=Emticicia sp. CRIBPO TaxID=2683258 RepID=UPI001411C09D|nr:hypothetical protein [Emticicia sp. CRIBPO]NBA87414.1 hypothetical protein [Emticicia sp. CRIBPO]